MRRLLFILLAVVVPAAAHAQKHCKKGIPCGGSCISPTKTCRVGTATVPATTAAPATQAGTPLVVTADSSATSGAWIASSRGHTYYKVGCAGANKLAAGNRLYFKSEDEAKKAGYVRSSQRGC
jgi:hypothetical protein